MAEVIRVRGLRKLNRALRGTERDVRLGMRAALREVVEPVRVTAEQLAVERISHIGPTTPRSWSRIRTGLTQNVVYIAPRQRGRASRVNYKIRRPNLADKLKWEVMAPSLDRNTHTVIAGFEALIKTAATKNGF